MTLDMVLAWGSGMYVLAIHYYNIWIPNTGSSVKENNPMASRSSRSGIINRPESNSNSLAKLIWLDKIEEIAVKTSSNRLSFLIFSLFQSAFFSLR